MMIDQGAIEPVNPGRSTPTPPCDPVPSTLTGGCRLVSTVAAAEKRALQQASIVGAVFLGPGTRGHRGAGGEQLPALVQRELTLPRADAPLEACANTPSAISAASGHL